jgi:hypothetical protein
MQQGSRDAREERGHPRRWQAGGAAVLQEMRPRTRFGSGSTAEKRGGKMRLLKRFLSWYWGRIKQLLIRFWHFATRPETKDEANDRQKYGF